MIDPEAGTFTVDRLTFLRDHANPAHFYHYPVAPTLAIGPSGQRAFSLLMYRRLTPRLGGAYLLLGLDLAASPAEVEAARPRVQPQVPGDRPAILEPLPFLHGEVCVVIVGSDPAAPYQMTGTLVMRQEQLVLTTTLTMQEAALVQAALAPPQLGSGLAYHLVFQGVRPAPAWQIQADWDHASQWLATQLVPTRAYALADILSLAGSVLAAGIIQIHADSAWGDSDPLGLDSVHTFLAEFMASHFFKLDYAVDPGGKPACIFRPMQGAAVPPVIDLNGATVERHLFGQVALTDLLPASAGPVAAFIDVIDLDDQQVQVTIMCPLLGETVEWLAVDLEYGPPGTAEKRTVTLRSPQDQPTVRWLLNPALGRTYRYSYRGMYRSSAFQAASYEFASPAVERQESMLIVDLQPPVLTVDIILFPQAGLQQVDVDLGYDDAAHGLQYRQSLTLDVQHPQQHWVVLLSDPPDHPYWYEARYHLLAGDTIAEARRTSTDPYLILQPPSATGATAGHQ